MSSSISSLELTYLQTLRLNRDKRIEAPRKVKLEEYPEILERKENRRLHTTFRRESDYWPGEREPKEEISIICLLFYLMKTQF
jgi:hypothetical protein